jgi:hypothetical protein
MHNMLVIISTSFMLLTVFLAWDQSLWSLVSGVLALVSAYTDGAL